MTQLPPRRKLHQLKKKPPADRGVLAQFRLECEKSCRRELDARVVTILAQGAHAEIRANVTTTRLYQNLTDSTPCMGFYDGKKREVVQHL